MEGRGERAYILDEADGLVRLDALLTFGHDGLVCKVVIVSVLLVAKAMGDQ